MIYKEVPKELEASLEEHGMRPNMYYYLTTGNDAHYFIHKISGEIIPVEKRKEEE